MLYLRGRIWWTKFRLGGKVHRLSTGSENKRAARVEEARLKVQASRHPDRGPRRRGAIPALNQAAIEDIAEAEDRGYSEGEQGARATFWRNLRDHFGDGATLEAVTKASVIRYEGTRRAKGVRGQTIRKEVACLKRAFERAAEAGIDVRPPVRWPTIRSNPADPRRRGRLVEPAVFRAWVARLPDELRDEMLVASLTGLREAELHRLSRAWVVRVRGGWILRVPDEASKVRRGRDVPLPARAKEILDRYPEEGAVFPRERWQGRYWLRKAARELGLERNGVTLRDLRTTFASLALERTGDAQAVQAALGHSDLRTTQRYQRTTLERAQRVGEAISEAFADPPARRASRKK